MSWIRRALIAAVVLAIFSFFALPSQAEHPSYLILRTPTSNAAKATSYGYSPGYGFATTTHAYSYGWFGAQPREHWSRHFGTNRAFTQWSSR